MDIEEGAAVTIYESVVRTNDAVICKKKLIREIDTFKVIGD